MVMHPQVWADLHRPVTWRRRLGWYWHDLLVLLRLRERDP
jgi:hypothetical protein